MRIRPLNNHRSLFNIENQSDEEIFYKRINILVLKIIFTSALSSPPCHEIMKTEKEEGTEREEEIERMEETER